MIQSMRFILPTLCLLFLFSTICLAQKRDGSEKQVSFEVVLNRVLPIEERLGLNIGFRSHRDLYIETLEYSFLLSFNHPNNKVSFISRAPEGISVANQFLALSRQNPNAAIEDLIKQIKIKRQTLTEEQCPALRQLFFSFEKISFRPPSSELIVLHPMIYEIKSSFGAGDMYLTFVEKDQPIVKWAFIVKAVAEMCVANLKNQK